MVVDHVLRRDGDIDGRLAQFGMFGETAIVCRQSAKDVDLGDALSEPVRTAR